MNKGIIVPIAAILIIIGIVAIYKISTPPLDNKSLMQESTSQSSDQNAKNTSVPADNGSANSLKIVTTQPGTGSRVVKGGDIVAVQYTGKLTDGTKFDSSYDHGGQPFTFKVGVGQVIQGWDQGIIGMKVGEKRTLTIPADLAYGAAGIPGVIPPNATLVFDVELVSIN